MPALCLLFDKTFVYFKSNKTFNLFVNCITMTCTIVAAPIAPFFITWRVIESYIFLQNNFITSSDGVFKSIFLTVFHVIKLRSQWLSTCQRLVTRGHDICVI